jgi:hypothetical protein
MAAELRQKLPGAFASLFANKDSLQFPAAADGLFNDLHTFKRAVAVVRRPSRMKGGSQFLYQSVLAAGDGSQAI